MELLKKIAFIGCPTTFGAGGDMNPMEYAFMAPVLSVPTANNCASPKSTIELALLKVLTPSVKAQPVASPLPPGPIFVSAMFVGNGLATVKAPEIYNEVV